ncbi:hypothetical protein HRR83_001988 [Exophiala dermatitidis]|uniref:Uncharacterized protein n=1 Tax=Exophiala dermatitidis TaxID=5970 RepID=A0AAN6EZV5_EXODE|nr:hypothetical protein HRR73_005390 [Exophiala dermatitidis]KAJ4520032.1 hypothetical protein HRR75_001895 [Exophiala dermatitidis]KAJ4523870.1 hypothetical protein HRR74_002065 [Exophiala dermatitidis]KAJ4537190.1 hypothetical protein HRR76_005203 [Exophiala dermatitidis]KAJ4555212.1 hypothetical protein HRR77_001152 [Exophiala dermatitidis]
MDNWQEEQRRIERQPRRVSSLDLLKQKFMKGALLPGLQNAKPKPLKSDAASDSSARRDNDRRIVAKIAARKAMKRWWKRYPSSESDLSERSFPGQVTPPSKRTRSKGLPSWTTPRRHKPVGTGLLNKTLRTTKRTAVPRPSSNGFTRLGGHHTHTSSTSEAATASENYGALPSSYRRLHRAKSMLTTRRRTMGSQDNSLSSPVGRIRIPRRSTSFGALQTNSLRLRIKRSLTILRPKSKNALFITRPEDSAHDEAIKIARARFLDGEHQHMELRQSVPPASGRDTVHNPLSRECMSPHSADSGKYPIPLGNGYHCPQTDPDKRSLSVSLRAKLRKALGKSGKGSCDIPPQQLEAQRTHFRELPADTESISGFDAYCTDEENQHRRQSVYIPSSAENEPLEHQDQVPYNLDLAASRESLHSNTRSRVTSWTNSSMTGSIGLRSGPMERNRLSIIKEDGGPHQPSSSAGRHFGGVSLFREPLQPTPENGLTMPVVDSQRIYSALIKRINQEEAEIERTRLAFEAINQETDTVVNVPTNARPTIRVVHSDSSLTTVPAENHGGQFSSRSCSWDQPEGGMTPEQHKENLERRRERLAMQETQSSFFPFSSEQNPSAPSPFKKFLQDNRVHKRSSNLGEESDLEKTGAEYNHDTSNQLMDRRHFGFSSESVYSRTTNGGVNDEYRSPIWSSEELSLPTDAATDLAGMATIMPTVYCRPGPRTLSGSDNLSVKQVQCSEWNPWSDGPSAQRGDGDVQSSAQTRELAQVWSGGNPRSDEREVSNATAQSNASDDSRRLGAVKFIRDNNVSRPRSNFAATSHTGMLNRAGGEALKPIPNQVEEGKKMVDSARKLSPGNLARMLREKKSQIMTRQHESGKENIPADRNDSPPLSTPGKLQLQFRNGNTTGRLRKKASEPAFSAQKGLHTTPRTVLTTSSTTPSHRDDSPSEKVKDHLVARLSRPFNMDVPPHNRPFDSMYLGKRTPGHPDTIGNSRLSVAPCVPPKPESDNVNEPTEYGAPGAGTGPLESSTSTRNTSKVLGLFNSKRMVSSFLKSRRSEKSRSSEKSVSGSGQSMAGEGPAFI